MVIQVTAADLKADLGKYLSLVGREEIRIIENGKDIALLTAPQVKRNWVDDISGIIPNSDTDIKAIKAERLAQKHESLD